MLGRLHEVYRTAATCSSSPAPAPARSSRRSSTSARPASACSPSRRATSASAGRRWRAPSAARSRSSATPGVRRRAPTTCARKLDEIEPVSLVFLVHSETSTGVVADVQALGAVAKEAGALVVVDAVSSLGAVPLEMDEWGLDVVVSGSQKALMTPPGLATAAVSPAALGAGRASHAAALLLRLGADAESAGEARQRLHARGLAHRRARRRPRALARGRARRRVRPPRAARPRLPRRDQGDGARALLARRGPLGGRHRRAHARRDRLGRADAGAPRAARRHDRRRPGRAQGRDLPDRSHRLVRRVRHRDGALRGRARAGASSARRSSAASPRRARSRSTPKGRRSESPRPGADRATRASSCCARGSTSTWTATRRSRT